MAKTRKSRGGWGGFALGLVVGVVLASAGAAAYLRYTAPSKAAATAKPTAFEKTPALPPLEAEPQHEIKAAPFGTSEDVFEAGAHVYKTQCALCHGTPGHDVPFARYMDPIAPQLWRKHAKGDVVGVSDDSVGETYWKVSNGLVKTGMPAYRHVLSDTQRWQVSLLLKNADQALPDPVIAILSGTK